MNEGHLHSKEINLHPLLRRGMIHSVFSGNTNTVGMGMLMDRSPLWGREVSQNANAVFESVSKIITWFNTEFAGEVRAGKGSFILLKPWLQRYRTTRNDMEIAHEAVKWLDQRYDVMGVFSTAWGPNDVDDFYSAVEPGRTESPADSMRRIPPARLKNVPDRLQELRLGMSSGPTTAIFLHREEGNIIHHLRDENSLIGQGKWNPALWLPGQLRFEIAVGFFNNIPGMRNPFKIHKRIRNEARLEVLNAMTGQKVHVDAENSETHSPDEERNVFRESSIVFGTVMRWLGSLNRIYRS